MSAGRSARKRGSVYCGHGVWGDPRIEQITAREVKVGDEIWEPGLGFQTVTEVIEQCTDPNQEPFLIRCADAGERYDYEEPVLRRAPRELPGDGQRPDVLDLLGEALNLIEHELAAMSVECEQSAAGVVSRGRALLAAVRDTEREREPAEPPMNFENAQEVGEAMDYTPIDAEAKRQAHVLAEALDQFFYHSGRPPRANPSERLWAAVEPTLRALGYPKETTS